jgi:leucyl-tRNA synthetase
VIKFEIRNPKSETNSKPEIQNSKHYVEVFTTRPDTLFGATFLAISAELAQKWLDVGWTASEEVKKYVADTLVENTSRTYEEKEKTGIFAGVTAINPANGKEIPVWAVNYVLGDVGTGAIMAVPANDERDFEFAKKYNLPIQQVIAPIITLTGVFAPQEDKPKTERNVTTAIVRRKGTDRYLLLSFNGGDGCGFVGGGIDGEETPEETIKREVREETGYKNFSVQEIPMLSFYGHGFKYRKDVNCFDCDKAFFVEILDDAQDELSEKEKSEHKIIWVDANEVSSCVSLEHHKYIWGNYQAGDQPFTGIGKLVNSGQFNGMNSEEAKKAITKFVGGKMKTTYKLRDWVFSRQRYWGEPIPIIHCEARKNTKQKVLLVYGFEGSPTGNWMPWMKRELEARGFEVFAPELPNAAHPVMEAWLDALVPILQNFTAEDIVIGHSLGSKAAIHAIEKAGKKLKHAYLVASAIGEIETRDWEKMKENMPNSDITALQKFWREKTDYGAVSRLTNVTTIISDDDPYIPIKTHDDIPREWEFKMWRGFKHFQGKQIPELLEEFLRSKNTGAIPVPEKDLPVKLPEVEFYEPTGTGESPLAAISSWVNVKCPKCGGDAKRETNTMPQWAGSSWYYLRFIDPKNSEALVDKEKEKYWSPVDMYVGGAEHATRHLIYARFWHKFLYDIGAVNSAEPFLKLHNVGLILAEDGRKMSKRWGNVVNPDDVVREYGADAFRVYEMFMGPFEQSTAWSTEGIIGPRRFLEKVWKAGLKVCDSLRASTDARESPKTVGFRNSVALAGANSKIETLWHQTIKKITEDIEGFKFNTAISTLMIFANALEKEEAITAEMFGGFLRLLSPFAPHITEELWREMGNENSMYIAKWPAYDEGKTKSETMTIVVQVNGKARASFETQAGSLEETVTAQSLALPEIEKWLERKKPKKIIYVPGKIVSIVV